MTRDAAGSQVAHVLKHATHILATAGCDTPRLDSEVLLAHVLDQDRAWLYAHPEYALDPSQQAAYHVFVSRRAERRPVAYLTGHQEFFGLDFFVSPHVLIPRPETELLVEQAIHRATTASGHPKPRMTKPESWADSSLVIADLGTGSGAIAVTLALHLPQARLIAIDISPAALAVARRNAARHGVDDRVHCLQADLLAPLAISVDLILANPPYLSHAELAAAPPEVARWEPRTALDGGPDGLVVIRHLLDIASDRLSPGGALLVEIGAGQGAGVLELARFHFPGATVEIARDYAGRDRLLVVQYAR
jgi:release factor glutamine methyltransferase